MMSVNISCARKALAGLGLSVLLVGCVEDAPPAKTVDWYKANAAERLAVLQECSQNPGEKGDSPDCKNAIAAESALSVGSLK